MTRAVLSLPLIMIPAFPGWNGTEVGLVIRH